MNAKDYKDMKGGPHSPEGLRLERRLAGLCQDAHTRPRHADPEDEVAEPFPWKVPAAVAAAAGVGFLVWLLI
jgi:hypothetical protein